MEAESEEEMEEEEEEEEEERYPKRQIARHERDKQKRLRARETKIRRVGGGGKG